MKRVLNAYGTLLALLIAVLLPLFWIALFVFGRGSGFARGLSFGPIYYSTEILTVFTLVMAPAAVFRIYGVVFGRSKDRARPGLSALCGFSVFQATLFLALYLIFAAPWTTISTMDWGKAFRSLGQSSDTVTPPSDEDLEYPELPLRDSDPYAWSVYDLQGNEVPLSQFKDKAVFMNFWATWCGYCTMEFPNIQRLYTAMKDEPGIAFMLLSPEEPDVVRGWLEKQDYTLPFYTIPRDKLPPEFTPRGLPTTFFMAPDGRVAFTHSGFTAWDGEKTRQFLRDLAPAPVAALDSPVAAETTEAPSVENTLPSDTPAS